MIISFNLYNILTIFQIFINLILYAFLDYFAIIYLNDILIYSKTREKYITHVNQILNALNKAELYLNINKSEFFAKEVRYLGLFIIINNI